MICGTASLQIITSVMVHVESALFAVKMKYKAAQLFASHFKFTS